MRVVECDSAVLTLIASRQGKRMDERTGISLFRPFLYFRCTSFFSLFASLSRSLSRSFSNLCMTFHENYGIWEMEFSTEGKIWGKTVRRNKYLPSSSSSSMFPCFTVVVSMMVWREAGAKKGSDFFLPSPNDSLFLPSRGLMVSAPDFINHRVFSISSITRNEVGFVCVLRLSFPFF